MRMFSYNKLYNTRKILFMRRSVNCKAIVNQLTDILYKISNILVNDFNKLINQSSESGRGKFTKDIDEKIEYLLIKELQRNISEIPILFEGYKKIEGEKTNLLFIIDPVDGTANFQNNNKDFGISIALQENEKTILGMVMFPLINELFIAVENDGVYFLDLNQHAIKARTLNKIAKSKMVLMTRSSMLTDIRKFEILQHFIKQKVHLRCIGCVSMDMAMLACGRAQMIIYDTTKIWDIAAGELLIKESGGFIYRQDDYFIAASSQRLIDEIKKLL